LLYIKIDKTTDSLPHEICSLKYELIATYPDKFFNQRSHKQSEGSVARWLVSAGSHITLRNLGETA